MALYDPHSLAIVPTALPFIAATAATAATDVSLRRRHRRFKQRQLPTNGGIASAVRLRRRASNQARRKTTFAAASRHLFVMRARRRRCRTRLFLSVAELATATAAIAAINNKQLSVILWPCKPSSYLVSRHHSDLNQLQLKSAVVGKVIQIGLLAPLQMLAGNPFHCHRRLCVSNRPKRR